MSRNIKAFFNLRSTVFQFAILLTFLSIYSILSNVLGNYDPEFSAKVTISYVTLTFVGIIFTLVSKYLFKDKFLNPNNVIITTSIIFLLLMPVGEMQLILIPGALLFTLIINKFLRYKKMPIFNPAAVGLTGFYVLLEIFIHLGLLKENIFISWWGANLFKGVDPLNLLQIIVGIGITGLLIYFSYFYKKTNLTFSFILSFLVFTFISSMTSGILMQDLLWGYLRGNLLFLTFVMIAEPKTSTTNPQNQILYGILGGLLLFLLSNLRSRGIIDYSGSIELLVILMLNAIFFLEKNGKSIISNVGNIQTASGKTA